MSARAFTRGALLGGLLCGVGLLAWALAADGGATPRPTASESLTPVQAVLKEIGLQPTDLSEGSNAVLVEKGNRLAAPSLSFCGGDFPSEAKRLVRRLTESVEPAGRVGRVTTDVIQYESIPAALEALDEVRIEAALCAESSGERLLELAVEGVSTTDDAYAAQLESGVGDARSLHSILWEVRGNVLVILSLEVTPNEADTAAEWSEFRRLAALVTGRLNAIDPVEIGYF